MGLMAPMPSRLMMKFPTDEFGPDEDYPFESDELWSK